MQMVKQFLFLGVIALLALLAHAQTPTGTIGGFVSDKSGAAIQGAAVTATAITTGEQHSTKTDVSGRYVIPFLEPGTYNVSVSASGFSDAQLSNVVVQVTETRKQDFSLTVGTVNQSVQVNATVETLDTETSTVGETIQSKTFLELPDNGRNPFDFAVLAPGVTVPSANTGMSGIGGGVAATPHIGGGRNNNEEVMIDGMTNILPENTSGNSLNAYQPVEDSIQEVNVQTNVPSAEYGRFSGGVISLITKSGGNQFHGGFFEFIQNSGLDAYPFGAPGVANPNPAKPSQYQYQTGGSIGGPILFPRFNGRNRAFFFFDYENSHEEVGQVITDSVPNPAWLGGDFTSLFGSTTPMLFDPDTVAKNNSGVYQRQPLGYNGQYNVIPPSRISPVTAAVLAYYPKPNVPGAGLYNNYQVSGSLSNNYWHFDSRIDVDVTKKWHTFLRYSQLASNPFQGNIDEYHNASSPNYMVFKEPAFSGTFENTVAFTPTLLGEFRFGFSKQNQNRKPGHGPFDPATLGFDSGFNAQVAQEAETFPNFTFGGNGSLSQIGFGGWNVYEQDPVAASIFGSLVKIAGQHSLKFGGEFRLLKIGFFQDSFPAGTFASDDSWTRQFPQSQDTTGFSVASFLLGLPSYGWISEDEFSKSKSQYWALYLQDDWKVSPKLTLNVGLRWDQDVPRTESKNQYSTWDPNAPSPLQSANISANLTSGEICTACSNLRGAMALVGTPAEQYGRRQGPFPKWDFGPRLGLAYNPTPKIVVRAGAGIIFQPSELIAAGTTSNPGNEGFQSQTLSLESLSGTQDSIPNASLYSPDPVILANKTAADPNPGQPFSAGYSVPQGHQASCIANAACVQGIDLGTSVLNSWFDSYRTPYSIEWSANTQFALPWNMKLEVGYMANKGLFLINGDEAKPYDQLSAGTMAQYGCTPGAPVSACQLLNEVNNPFYGVFGPGTQYTVGPTTLSSSPQIIQAALVKQWPQYAAAASYRKANAASMFNGATVRLDKALSNGLTFTFSLTDGREYDNSASPVGFLGATSGTYDDQYNPGAEWALGAQNVNYQVVSSFVYELPFGHGRRFMSTTGAADKVLGGWGLSGIETWTSGTPIVLGGVDNGTTTLVDQSPDASRPYWTGQSAKLQNKSYKRWFNTSVFSMPAAFAFGNSPRTLGNVQNPPYQNLDLAVLKNTKWGDAERYNVQFRLEMFNAFNHPSLGNPNTGLTSGQFGVISSYNGTARRIQIAGKVTF